VADDLAQKASRTDHERVKRIRLIREIRGKSFLYLFSELKAA